MLRVAAAPCSPFSVSRDADARVGGARARATACGLHTHLAESDNDVAYSRERFGCTPAEYAEALGWTGPRRVARALRQARSRRHRRCSREPAPASRIARPPTCGSARASRRCARCSMPAYPCRLASTAARRTTASHLLAEARQALLLQRVGAWTGGADRRAKRWRSRRAAARRCSAATTSASSRPAWPPTSSRST